MTTAPPMNAERVCSGICILRQRLVYFSVVAIIYISVLIVFLKPFLVSLVFPSRFPETAHEVIHRDIIVFPVKFLAQTFQSEIDYKAYSENSNNQRITWQQHNNFLSLAVSGACSVNVLFSIANIHVFHQTTK